MDVQWWRATGAMIMCLVVVPVVNGQADEQTRLLAKRSAEADCYRKLAETIKGIQINSETYVRDFVAESDVIESEMDAFIKGVRLGHATYYDDGMCEVAAEVTVARVVEHLRQLHTRHYQGDRVVGTDFDQIGQTISKKVIKVTGMGAPRPDLPPNLPQGVEEVIGAPVPMPRSGAYPENWRPIPAQAKLMAMQAARLDAQRKLLERIMGVRINSKTLVRDFVAEYDEILSKADGLVIGAEEVRRYFHHNELIVEVTMGVPTEQVVRTITELHTRHYQGDRVSGTDVEQVRETIKRKRFEATGSGVPPRMYIARASSSTGMLVPEWAAKRITAAGRGTDPQIETPQGRLRALRAATVDARRNLIERLDRLQLTSNTVIREYVMERNEVRTQIHSVIAGSVVEDRKVEGRTATVVVSVAGPQVWSTLHSQMLIESRN